MTKLKTDMVEMEEARVPDTREARDTLANTDYIELILQLQVPW